MNPFQFSQQLPMQNPGMQIHPVGTSAMLQHGNPYLGQFQSAFQMQSGAQPDQSMQGSIFYGQTQQLYVGQQQRAVYQGAVRASFPTAQPGQSVSALTTEAQGIVQQSVAGFPLGSSTGAMQMPLQYRNLGYGQFPAFGTTQLCQPVVNAQQAPFFVQNHNLVAQNLQSRPPQAPVGQDCGAQKPPLPSSNPPPLPPLPLEPPSQENPPLPKEPPLPIEQEFRTLQQNPDAHTSQFHTAINKAQSDHMLEHQPNLMAGSEAPQHTHSASVNSIAMNRATAVANTDQFHGTMVASQEQVSERHAPTGHDQSLGNRQTTQIASISPGMSGPALHQGNQQNREDNRFVGIGTTKDTLQSSSINFDTQFAASGSHSNSQLSTKGFEGGAMPTAGSTIDPQHGQSFESAGNSLNGTSKDVGSEKSLEQLTEELHSLENQIKNYQSEYEKWHTEFVQWQRQHKNHPNQKQFVEYQQQYQKMIEQQQSTLQDQFKELQEKITLKKRKTNTSQELVPGNVTVTSLQSMQFVSLEGEQRSQANLLANYNTTGQVTSVNKVNPPGAYDKNLRNETNNEQNRPTQKQQDFASQNCEIDNKQKQWHGRNIDIASVNTVVSTQQQPAPPSRGETSTALMQGEFYASKSMAQQIRPYFGQRVLTDQFQHFAPRGQGSMPQQMNTAAIRFGMSNIAEKQCRDQTYGSSLYETTSNQNMSVLPEHHHFQDNKGTENRLLQTELLRHQEQPQGASRQPLVQHLHEKQQGTQNPSYPLSIASQENTVDQLLSVEGKMTQHSVGKISLPNTRSNVLEQHNQSYESGQGSNNFPGSQFHDRNTVMSQQMQSGIHSQKWRPPFSDQQKNIQLGKGGIFEGNVHPVSRGIREYFPGQEGNNDALTGEGGVHSSHSRPEFSPRLAASLSAERLRGPPALKGRTEHSGIVQGQYALRSEQLQAQRQPRPSNDFVSNQGHPRVPFIPRGSLNRPPGPVVHEFSPQRAMRPASYPSGRWMPHGRGSLITEGSEKVNFAPQGISGNRLRGPIAGRGIHHYDIGRNFGLPGRPPINLEEQRKEVELHTDVICLTPSNVSSEDPKPILSNMSKPLHGTAASGNQKSRDESGSMLPFLGDNDDPNNSEQKNKETTDGIKVKNVEDIKVEDQEGSEKLPEGIDVKKEEDSIGGMDKIIIKEPEGTTIKQEPKDEPKISLEAKQPLRQPIQTLIKPAVDAPGKYASNCRFFPNCRYGKKCYFQHPECPSGLSCGKEDCVYFHTTLVLKPNVKQEVKAPEKPQESSISKKTPQPVLDLQRIKDLQHNTNIEVSVLKDTLRFLQPKEGQTSPQNTAKTANVPSDHKQTGAQQVAPEFDRVGAGGSGDPNISSNAAERDLIPPADQGTSDDRYKEWNRSNFPSDPYQKEFEMRRREILNDPYARGIYDQRVNEEIPGDRRGADFARIDIRRGDAYAPVSGYDEQRWNPDQTSERVDSHYEAYRDERTDYVYNQDRTYQSDRGDILRDSSFRGIDERPAERSFRDRDMDYMRRDRDDRFDKLGPYARRDPYDLPERDSVMADRYRTDNMYERRDWREGDDRRLDPRDRDRQELVTQRDREMELLRAEERRFDTRDWHDGARDAADYRDASYDERERRLLDRDSIRGRMSPRGKLSPRERGAVDDPYARRRDPYLDREGERFRRDEFRDSPARDYGNRDRRYDREYDIERRQDGRYMDDLDRARHRLPDISRRDYDMDRPISPRFRDDLRSVVPPREAQQVFEYGHGRESYPARRNYRDELRENERSSTSDDTSGVVRGNVNANILGDVRGEVRGDFRGEVRGDIRGDIRGVVRGDVRGEVRGDLRGDIRGDSRSEFRVDGRGEYKDDYSRRRDVDSARRDHSHRRDSRDQRRESHSREKEKEKAAESSIEVVAVKDLLEKPGRLKRPKQIVVILRGPPGCGKTHIARLIKDKEVSHGAHAPRILGLDDYFLQEVDKYEKDPETGKKKKVKKMEYVYEEEMESSYRNSLLKSFNKTLDGGLFPMVIIDAINDKVKHFEKFWSDAKHKGFEVYVAELMADANECAQKNTHNRTVEDIDKILKKWEPTPKHFKRLDVRALLQDAAIEEVEMEEVVAEQSDDKENKKGDQGSDDDEDNDGIQRFKLTKSKWDDTNEEQLAKLDGIRPKGTKRPAGSPLMPDYDDDPYDEVEADIRIGKKRVRWADIEERKQLEHRKKIGFCIGTDWNVLTDPNAQIPI